MLLSRSREASFFSMDARRRQWVPVCRVGSGVEDDGSTLNVARHLDLPADKISRGSARLQEAMRG